MKDCLVITTGGTIDRDFATRDTANPYSKSFVPEAIMALGLKDKCEVLHWRRRSSNAFLSSDIDELATIIEHSNASHIIVTHGTERMVENSKRLARKLQGTGKVVVFTGALVPLSVGRDISDGYENLRVAIDEVSRHSPGVHIEMQGQWFNPHAALKDIKTGIFRPMNPKEPLLQKFTEVLRLNLRPLAGRER